MARVSNQARFCHHCGKRINPERVAGSKSELCCPVCRPQRQLISRAWREISIFECNRCAGMWLSHEAFRIATEQAAAETTAVNGLAAPRNARPPSVDAVPPDGGKRYRPCVDCNQLMQRQQFGRGSGVIIDLCKHHGIWFDADELARIIHWIQHGGAVQAERYQADDLAREEAIERRKAAASAGRKRSPADPWTSDAEPESFLEEAIRWLFRV
jgi:Zn-finger nucleic acid-binding protein